MEWKALPFHSILFSSYCHCRSKKPFTGMFYNVIKRRVNRLPYKGLPQVPALRNNNLLRNDNQSAESDTWSLRSQHTP